MKNKQFDELMRRRIDSEELTMNQWSERRIAHAVRTPIKRAPARRVSLRVLVVSVLVFLLLCGVAIAAVTWNSRAFLTQPSEDGTPTVNEALLSYVQPVGTQYVSGRLQMDIIDAIFDGNALVMTWTLTNTGNESLYLLCDVLMNDEYPGQGGYSNVDELFLAPGETIESGLSARIDVDGTAESADTCDIAMHFAAFTYTGEIVPLEGLDSESTEEDRAQMDRWIDEQIAQGNIVLAPDGVIELGSKMPPYEEGMTRTDQLAASGVMTKADTLNVKLPIQRNAEAATATSADGSMEKDNGAYILRVTRAELTPNTATIDLERVFKTKADAEAFSAYYSEKLGPYWGFSVLDETGDIWWSNNSGGGATTETPQEMDDGSWVWGYQFTAVSIVRPPKTLTIVPTRDDPVSGEFNVAHPEEGITLTYE